MPLFQENIGGAHGYPVSLGHSRLSWWILVPVQGIGMVWALATPLQVPVSGHFQAVLQGASWENVPGMLGEVHS